MEILKTGGLERIKYENTQDVEATRTFQGIYGVGKHPASHRPSFRFSPAALFAGQKIAFQWYACGCRTLDDVKARKGGIKLSAAQEIGLRFYDGSLVLYHTVV
jgi:DNA polymerase lambda